MSVDVVICSVVSSVLLISTVGVGTSVGTSVGVSVEIGVRVGSGDKVDSSGISTRGISVGSAVTTGSGVSAITLTFR